ncbi:MAG: nucleotidyltransferase family protein [Oscillospiraceae bacterium]|nr:nucleotidyltransferase family protein [Oscillospiraceae bacterium]MBR2366461.1 nucleotidyltransferase family protein [Oscillospiraceae bacterium]
MMKNRTEKADRLQTAIRVLSAALWEHPAPAIPVSEEDYDFLEAQALLALPKDLVKDLNLSDELREIWKQKLFLHLRAYLQSLHGLGELTKLLTAEGITPIVLKGLSFASYYRDPALRQTGDVDVILHPNTEENFCKACAIMESAGFSDMSDPNDRRHVTYGKNGVCYELHRYFSHRKNETQLELDRRIDSAVPVEKTIGGVRFYTLPDLENGLVMLMHIALHLPSGLGLRHVLDWFVFADRIVDEAFLTNGFREAVHVCGLETLMYSLTRMGALWFDLPEQTWCVFRDDAVSAELLDLLIDSGNFGRSKDPMSRRATTALNSYMSFRTLQSHGLVHWKAAQRYKILRPFAWIYQLCRYLCLAVSRRSVISSAAGDYRDHRAQKKLFDKLDLQM